MNSMGRPSKAEQEIFLKEEMCTLVQRFPSYGFTYASPLDTLQVGSHSHVQFHAESVYERFDTKKDVVGFFHTHPPGADWISGTDILTMQGWSLSLGIPLFCVIECEKKLMAWKFFEDQFVRAKIKRFGKGFVLF